MKKEFLEKIEIQHKTRKSLMYVAMIGMIMLFAGFTSAYLVRYSHGEWLSFELPSLFYVSTVFILLTSIFLFLAVNAAKKNNMKLIKIAIGVSFLTSISFMYSQFSAYVQMLEIGYYFVGTSISISFLYILTFLHLIHMFGGNIALLVSFIKSLHNKYNKEKHLGLELTSIYCHFLGIIWIYLLLFLKFIN